jgi:hypothetical protein
MTVNRQFNPNNVPATTADRFSRSAVPVPEAFRPEYSYEAYRMTINSRPAS